MSESSGVSSELVLHEYLRVLRRRKWVVVLVAVLAAGGALGFALSQDKIYQASAEILLEHRSTRNLFDAVQDIGDPSRLPQTEMKVMQSQPVREEVRKRIGMAPAITTGQSGSADVIDLTARSTVPATAAKIANTYAEAYINYRRTSTVDDILAASNEIQLRIDDLQRQLDALAAQAGAVGQSPTANALITARSTALISQQNVFKQKLSELQVSTALSTGGAQIVNPATVPSGPVRPKPLVDSVLAGSVGLLIGIGLAFLLEYLDDSIKTKEHLERAIGTGIPVFGLIPPIERADRGGPGEAALVAPSSPAAEAYRALRTSVQFLGVDRPMVLQVTSASLSEGKTTTVVNLAAVFAQAGKRVILADCDLRRPRVHEFFGFSNAPGFTSVLLGDVSLTAASQRVTEIGQLLVLPSGPRPPNPSELLSSPRARDLLANLKASADIVLIDSPPMLPVTDASVLAAQVDAVLLVVMAGTTTRRPLQRAVELLRQMQVPVAGAVLTKVRNEAGYGYEYGAYTERMDEDRRRRVRWKGSRSDRSRSDRSSATRGGPDDTRTGERVVS